MAPERLYIHMDMDGTSNPEGVSFEGLRRVHERYFTLAGRMAGERLYLLQDGSAVVMWFCVPFDQMIVETRPNVLVQVYFDPRDKTEHDRATCDVRAAFRAHWNIPEAA